MTIHHYGDGLSRVLGPAPPAAAGYVALDGTEPGIILGLNLNNERTDVTGNHTMVDSVVYTAAKSYDGLRYAAQMAGGASGSLIVSDSVAANQIATAAPVSYGGMFWIVAAGSDDNATLLQAATSSGSTNQNYGVRYKKSNANYQRVPGAVDTTYGAGLEQWIHLVVVENAGRTTADWYVNGVWQEQTSPSATGQPNAGDKVRVGYSAGTSQAAEGWCSDVFISTTELSAGQVMTFATNAFGTTPPAAP